LIYKAGDVAYPSNFLPIALTSVTRKIFHKIISFHLEEYLQKDKVINTTIQNGFIASLSGVFKFGAISTM